MADGLRRGHGGNDRARCRLEAQLEAMASAGPLRRLYVTVKDFDPQIARRTLDDYESAAPLSLEALVAAGVAAVSGWAAIQLFAWPFPLRTQSA